MMEESLTQYGALGAVVLFFMGMFAAAFRWYTSNMAKVIENNTIALTKVEMVLKDCPRRRSN